MEKLLYEVSASLALWPADISAILTSFNFELADDDGSGVSRLIPVRRRTRLTSDIRYY